MVVCMLKIRRGVVARSGQANKYSALMGRRLQLALLSNATSVVSAAFGFTGALHPSPGFTHPLTNVHMSLKAISNSLSSAAARPISLAEFANALFSTWRQKPRQWHAGQTNTFGMLERIHLYASC